MQCSRSRRFIIAAVASGAPWAACVSYDPTGPHAAAIHGRFTGQMITVLQTGSPASPDTSLVTLDLRDSLYRGRFSGFYRFIDGDSGLVDGTLFSGGRVEVHHFGLWPPLTRVMTLARLYPSCSFHELGPVYLLNGMIQGDTLRLSETTTVPCSGQATTFEFQLLGIRRR